MTDFDFLTIDSISEPRLGVPGQPGSLDFEVALGSITAQDVMMKRQRMGLADFDGKKIHPWKIRVFWAVDVRS